MRLRAFSLATFTALALGLTGAPTAYAQDMTGWKKQIAKVIGKNQNYPRSAQIRKLEGTAKVKLVISGSGDIANFNLEEATGHAILDAEVERLVKKISPLPAPPNGSETTLIVPLSWRLQ